MAESPGPLARWCGPLTTSQELGLLTFIVLSFLDLAVSCHLFYGTAEGIVEANPALAWAAGGTALFLVAALGLKAIGTGLLALLASLVNRHSPLGGELVVLSAVGTTAALFAVEVFATGRL